VFPVRAEHKEEFRVLLEYAKMTGIQRVGFMRADSDTGQQHLKNVQALCQQLGLQLTADLPFKSDESDAQIAALAQRLGSSNTQLVFNHGGIGVYEKLIRQARQQGVKVQFSAVNSGATQLAANLGPLAQGMVVAQVVPSPWERKTAIAREYQDDFKQRHPGKAFSYGSLEGYITAKALVAALRLVALLADRPDFAERADAAARTLHGMVEAAPRFAGWALADALIEDQARSRLTPAVAVIVTDEASGSIGELARAAWRMAPAGTAIVVGPAGTQGFAHHFDDRTAQDGPTAYVCRGTVCFAPASAPKQLRAALWQRP